MASEELSRDATVWIVGTGGANLRKSSGNGKIVYAMRVDETLSRGEYYNDRRFARKRPSTVGTYTQKQGDNLRPKNEFERTGQFALISRHFFYFGANAIGIPKEFVTLEKKGPGFKSRFGFDIERFVKWLEKSHQLGRRGEPCKSEVGENGKCKSSCSELG